MPYVFQYKESIQYDGTNGSYIIHDWLHDSVTLVSDTGTELAWLGDNPRSVPLNGWVLKDVGSNTDPQNFTDVDYQAYWTEAPQTATLGMGYSLTPSIEASASANIAVDLDVPMPGTDYVAKAVLSGTADLLTDLVITAVTVTDSNTVTVTVHNSGSLVLAGATVIVTAIKLV